MIKSYLFDIVSPIVINILILSLDYGSNMKSRKFTTSHSRHQQSTRLILHIPTYLQACHQVFCTQHTGLSLQQVGRYVCTTLASGRSTLYYILYHATSKQRSLNLQSSAMYVLPHPSILQLSMQIITKLATNGTKIQGYLTL